MKEKRKYRLCHLQSMGESAGLCVAEIRRILRERERVRERALERERERERERVRM